MTNAIGISQKWFHTREEANAYAEHVRKLHKYDYVIVSYIYGGHDVPNWQVAYW